MKIIQVLLMYCSKIFLFVQYAFEGSNTAGPLSLSLNFSLIFWMPFPPCQSRSSNYSSFTKNFPSWNLLLDLYWIDQIFFCSMPFTMSMSHNTGGKKTEKHLYAILTGKVGVISPNSTVKKKYISAQKSACI